MFCVFSCNSSSISRVACNCLLPFCYVCRQRVCKFKQVTVCYVSMFVAVTKGIKKSFDVVSDAIAAKSKFLSICLSATSSTILLCLSAKSLYVQIGMFVMFLCLLLLSMLSRILILFQLQLQLQKSECWSVWLSATSNKILLCLSTTSLYVQIGYYL